jgi:hypothetical protein
MLRSRTLPVLMALVALASLAVPALAQNSFGQDYRFYNYSQAPYPGASTSNTGHNYVALAKRVVPGVIGAVGGFCLGGYFGIVGRVVGAVVGGLVADKIGQMIFPTQKYDNYNHYPEYYGNPAAQCPYGLGATSSTFQLFAPRAPQILDSKLSSLREDYYKALADYEEVLKSGSDAEKLAAKARYEEAYKVYNDAKKSALEQ